MTNLIGQSLGRYHILEKLGEGGMATVYKAYDTRLEADVAVKVIRTDKFTPEVLARALKRFEREAKALARLTHPNIVKVSDYGEYEGSPYLVMPYLPGGNLKAFLKQRGHLLWQEAVKLLLPIAEALDYAHSQNVIHRDVKPSNILLTERGQPMLTDFGVAKVLEEEATIALTGTGMGVGTPEYMAPEQFQGKAIDGRADIYSLGIVFFETLTGRKPYQADTPAAVIWMQASEPLPRPKQFAPDLPGAVEKVLLKALAKKPEDRYQSMGEFAAALEGMTAISPTAKTKESAPKRERPPKPEKTAAAVPSAIWKRWIPIAALVAILAISLAVGSGLLKMGQQGQGPLTGLATDTATATPTPFIPTITEMVRTLSAQTFNFTPSTTPVPTVLPAPAITSYGQDRIAFAVNNRVGYEVYTMKPDGSELTLSFQGSNRFSYLAWSPTGSNFGLVAWRDGESRPRVNIVNPNKSQTPLTSINYVGRLEYYWGEGLSWSPDGENIIFASQGSQYHLFQINVNNAFESSILSSPSGIWNPQWSPDGKLIAYFSAPSNSYNLYLVNADGTQNRQVTHFTEYNSSRPLNSISWFPDSKRVTVEGTNFFNPSYWEDELFLIDIDNYKVLNLTSSLDDVVDFAWSPGGDQIAISTRSPITIDTKSKISLLDANGNLNFAFEINGYASGLNWSPDGTKIVYYNMYNNSGIETLSVSDGSANLLVDHGSSPLWSPDGQRIVFIDGNSILMMNADGSGLTLLTTISGDNLSISNLTWLHSPP